MSILSNIDVAEYNRRRNRIGQIFGGPSSDDSRAAFLGGIAISEADYALIGAANSCAERNNPGIRGEALVEGHWFAGGDDLDISHAGWNCHTTGNRVDSFFTGIPRPQYRPTPEEVAWHSLRVPELKAGGLSVDQRIAVLTAEAQTKPWEHLPVFPPPSQSDLTLVPAKSRVTAPANTFWYTCFQWLRINHFPFRRKTANIKGR